MKFFNFMIQRDLQMRWKHSNKKKHSMLIKIYNIPSFQLIVDKNLLILEFKMKYFNFNNEMNDNYRSSLRQNPHRTQPSSIWRYQLGGAYVASLRQP